MAVLNHDYETYCDLNIKKTGGARYLRHPSLEILMCSYALDDGPVQLWVPAEGQPIPRELDEALRDPAVEKRGFNVPFEMGVTRGCLGIETPLSSYKCTMAEAYSLSFSGKLGEICNQVGVAEDKRKLEEGARLIDRFCSPAPANHRADRYDRFTHPDEWERFKLYCINDTEAEREIYQYIKPYQGMSDFEWTIWQIDQHINMTGVPVDRELAEKALRIHQQAKEKCLAEMKRLTGLPNPNSVDQLHSWLRLQGVEMPNMQAATVDVYSANENVPAIVRDVLRLKRRAGMNAPKKWTAYLDNVNDDGRIRGMFQYGGASRTRRWASRVINLQNLKSPRFPGAEDQDTCIEALKTGDVDLINSLYGDAIEFVGSMVRAGIKAPDGLVLGVNDLASIESVVVGWVSDCKWINDTFAQGLDTYKKMATRIFGVKYEEVTKPQRTFSKPVMLAGPYGQGARGLVAYAEDQFGLQMEEAEAKRHVDTFRTECWEIVDMWEWLDRSIDAAITSGIRSRGYKLEIYTHGDFLFIQMPSGRRLAYHKPLMEMKRAPWGALVPTFTYMGTGQNTRKWGRVRSHRGMITENIVQAIARDVLASGIFNAYTNGIQIIGHVHDEIIALFNEWEAEQGRELLEKCMTAPISWAPGLMLKADGYVAKHYKKD